MCVKLILWHTPLLFKSMVYPPFKFSEFTPERVIRDGRNYVAVGTWCRRRVVVKGYRRVTWANRMIYTWLRKTKAERAFRNARMLLRVGILSPEPLAWSLDKRFGIYHCAWYVSAYQPGLTLQEALECADPERRQTLIDLYIDTLRKLIDAQMLLKDSNLGNFIVVSDPRTHRLQLSLVDINRFIYGRPIKRREILLIIERSGFTGDEYRRIASALTQ